MENLLTDRRILNINFPIQSGSFRIVKRMGREYDPRILMERISRIKKANPHLVMKTNIIVGFPGENFSDFVGSLKSVFGFDAILAIPYTPRPGTGAMKYKDHVPRIIQKTRMLIIQSLVFSRHCYIALSSFSRPKLDLNSGIR